MIYVARIQQTSQTFFNSKLFFVLFSTAEAMPKGINAEAMPKGINKGHEEKRGIIFHTTVIMRSI